MQILSAAQIREWDEYTIREEPITSIDLMERASLACYEWLMEQSWKGRPFEIFCGKGNNGGDGLAIARMLALAGHNVTVGILEFGHKGTADFQANLARLHETDALIRFISTEDAIQPIHPDAIVIDAILGSGLNRPLDGLTEELVNHINRSGNTVVSIDIPTGLFADNSSVGNAIIIAQYTLSFQCFKLAFLVAENADFTGEIHILDIGLHPRFLSTIVSNYQWIDQTIVKAIIRPRKKFSHKGNYGHAAIIAGSSGMMGAAVLSARACLRAGAGKLTCHVPGIGYSIVQTSVPEAMCKTEEGNSFLHSLTDLQKYDAIGIGPGLGLYDTHRALLSQLFQEAGGQLVIDADALNVLGLHPILLKKLPEHTILTPHVKELERMFGAVSNDFERIRLAIAKAAESQVIIVLKGAYTMVATPGGMAWFNSTGNPGMATGGTGDVLTGILTGLLAQGYMPEQAAIAGVFLHGLAGDLAAEFGSQHSLIASDLVDHIASAYNAI